MIVEGEDSLEMFKIIFSIVRQRFQKHCTFLLYCFSQHI